MGFAVASDKRLKKDISAVCEAGEVLRKLKPVAFRWRNPLKSKDQRPQLVFIAQEVQEVLPTLVNKSDGTHDYVRPIKCSVKCVEDKLYMLRCDDEWDKDVYNDDCTVFCGHVKNEDDNGATTHDMKILSLIHI